MAGKGKRKSPHELMIEKSPIKELVLTDTIPIPPSKMLPSMTILSVAPLLGEAIRRIHTGQSVGALFNGH